MAMSSGIGAMVGWLAEEAGEFMRFFPDQAPVGHSARRPGSPGFALPDNATVDKLPPARTGLIDLGQGDEPCLRLR
jgi:hypothetical protein